MVVNDDTGDPIHCGSLTAGSHNGIADGPVIRLAFKVAPLWRLLCFGVWFYCAMTPWACPSTC